MDIMHHVRIVWRWRRIALAGCLLAGVLAIVVSFKPSTSGLEWRSQATYMSSSRLFVTQPGFPWGRATLPTPDATTPLPPDAQKLKSFAPPSRFNELAVVYSYLAQSDLVRDRVMPRPLEEQVTVATIPNPATGEPLPLLEITTMGSSQGASKELNQAVIAALGEYLEQNVKENRVPADERVQLEVLNPPKPGWLVGGRSLTLSAIVLILGLVATIIAIYILENVFPRTRRVTEDDEQREAFVRDIDLWDSLDDPRAVETPAG
jgi:hypothetical protein